MIFFFLFLQCKFSLVKKNERNAHFPPLFICSLFQACEKWAFKQQPVGRMSSGSCLKRFFFPFFFFFIFIPFLSERLLNRQAHTWPYFCSGSASPPRFVCISPASLYIHCQAMRSVPTQKYHMKYIMYGRLLQAASVWPCYREAGMFCTTGHAGKEGVDEGGRDRLSELSL